MKLISNILLIIFFLFSTILLSQNNDQQNDYDLIKKYKKLISIDNSNKDYYYNLGLIYLRLENYSEAKATFHSLSLLIPNDPSPYFFIGLAHERSNDYENAISFYEKTISKDSKYADAYFQLGVVCGYISKFNQSVFYFNEYIDLKPNDPSAYEYLGMSYLMNNNYLSAISPLKKASALNPNNSSLFYNLYLAYKNSGKKNEAISALKKAIYLDPENKVYVNDLKSYENVKKQTKNNFYTQVVDNICHVNFPLKPENMSDIVNKNFVYRFFNQEYPIIFLLETEYVGQYEYFNEPKKDVFLRLFLAEYLKKTYPATSIEDAAMADYESNTISFPGIKQKFSLTKNYNGRKLDQISDVWFIFHKKKKIIIKLIVTRFLFNYEEKESTVNKFFESLKIY